MMQMAISKVLSGVACVLMLCVSAPTVGSADQAQYIYDDLGRLSQVIDGRCKGVGSGNSARAACSYRRHAERRVCLAWRIRKA